MNRAGLSWSIVFLKRNKTSLAGKGCQSVLLVQGGRHPVPRPPKTVVIHESLANLSKLPTNLVALIEAF